MGCTCRWDNTLEHRVSLGILSVSVYISRTEDLVRARVTTGVTPRMYTCYDTTHHYTECVDGYVESIERMHTTMHVRYTTYPTAWMQLPMYTTILLHVHVQHPTTL